jgi:hypothetical protein
VPRTRNKSGDLIMETMSQEWLPFEDRDSSWFGAALLESCYLGKVFHFYETRNAWWRTCVRTYPAEASFSLDLETSRDRIGDRRRQGSYWTIDELPAIVFAGWRMA